ncbi:MAG: HAMP domain-containing histidine kinase [Actinobacteria bacterium]|nr:HAMP domain-containing histidine kinase [Actinomycetota bacterium]MBU1944204.1 HAMP domain-containing histidine kinase [Actinomycetota bacterium]MBU2688403.1 HAMP domain-containing histidine kinase [Actinomycetota bacterium]
MLTRDNPMTVKTKLVVGFSVLGAVVLVLAGLLTWALRASVDNRKTLMEAHGSLEHALELDGYISGQVGAAHALATGASDREDYDRSREGVEACFVEWIGPGEGEGTGKSAGQLTEVLDIRRSYEDMDGRLNGAVSLAREGRLEEAMMTFDGILAGSYKKQFVPRIRALIDRERLDVASSEAATNRAGGAARVLGWLAVALGVLVAVTVPVVLTREVFGSLDRLKRGMQSMSSGDYGSPIEVGKRDEFGELAGQFNRMSEDAGRLLVSEKEAAAARAEVEAAERHAEELRDLIDIAAHELRHPATMFMSYSEILLERGGDLDDEVVRDALETIKNASVRLTHIVTELLDTSRMERAIEIRPRDSDPRSLIETAVRELETGGVKANVNVDVRATSRYVSLDPERVCKVLVILMENAVEYSPEGSEVDVCYERLAGEALFHVSDRGPGIPEEDRERVFDRFYQVGDVIHHSLPGIGLGLFIAKEIITAHGGWTRVGPREGGGSTFTFAVPVPR